MQIENHKEEVPFAHYEELFSKLDASEAAARTGANWDEKEFYVNLLGREFAISHPDYAIRALDDDPIPPLPTQTFLLRFLLEGRRVDWAGQWKTFRDALGRDVYQALHWPGADPGSLHLQLQAGGFQRRLREDGRPEAAPR